MNSQPPDLDPSDEEILCPEFSDEAIEAAGGADVGRWSFIDACSGVRPCHPG
jgi:hypothetical protein